VLAECFDTALRLLIGGPVHHRAGEAPGRAPTIARVAAWPEADARWDDLAPAQFADVQGAVVAVRNIRAEYRVPPRIIGVTPCRGHAARRLRRERHHRAPGARERRHGRGRRWPVARAPCCPTGARCTRSRRGGHRQECQRLSTELERLDRQLAGLAAKLANEQFTARAPADVVARERDKEVAWRDQRTVLAGKLKALGCD
jgi:valyl-tRNA synthetase